MVIGVGNVITVFVLQFCKQITLNIKATTENKKIIFVMIYFSLADFCRLSLQSPTWTGVQMSLWPSLAVELVVYRLKSKMLPKISFITTTETLHMPFK